MLTGLTQLYNSITKPETIHARFLFLQMFQYTEERSSSDRVPWPVNR
jgi:hypothetical protein